MPFVKDRCDVQNLRVMNQSSAKGILIPSAIYTIVGGGLAIGVLDGIAAVINAALNGVTPTRVFQYISSSLLGAEAFNGGMMSVTIGVIMHFLVAFGAATAFYVLARIFPVVLRYAVVSGILYGVGVYFAMAYVIVPVTQVRQGPFSWNALIVSIIIHILFVGLPVALIARRYANR